MRGFWMNHGMPRRSQVVIIRIVKFTSLFAAFSWAAKTGTWQASGFPVGQVVERSDGASGTPASLAASLIGLSRAFDNVPDGGEAHKIREDELQCRVLMMSSWAQSSERLSGRELPVLESIP